MGTWIRNFVVADESLDVLRETIVKWLERKGFDQTAQCPLFGDDSDERAAFLISNPQRSIIIYREAFEEGDRLLMELDEFPVVLEIMIADSDVWGYELLEKGEITAAFNSNPGYFGGNEQKLPDNGDPDRLCSALRRPGRQEEVAKLQRKRSLFSEVPCRAFCKWMGATAASLSFDELEEWNDGESGPRNLAGWRIEPLYFERRKFPGEETRKMVLHSLSVRQFEPKDSRRVEFDPDVAKAMQSQIQLFRILFMPIGWILMLFARLFPIGWWLGRKLQRPKKAGVDDDLLEALQSTTVSPFVRDGSWLVSRKCRCRIRVPNEKVERDGLSVRSLDEVFRFSVHERMVNVRAIRPENVHQYFTLRRGTKLLEDESFAAGKQLARHVALRHAAGEKEYVVEHWFVEFERFILSFNVSATGALPPDFRLALKEIVQTIEVLP